MANLLSANDRLAETNRACLDEAGLFAINVLASPGAGKTSLIERPVRALAPALRLAVIDGDLAPTLDALPVGDVVLEVNPVRQLGANGTAWSRAVNGQVIADDSFLSRDPALTPVGLYTPGLSPKPFSPVDGVLFLKTSTARACG